MGWQRAESPNPLGRPRGDFQIRQLARMHTGEAIQALVDALGSKNERTRITAAEAILDRGWGRPGLAPAIADSGERKRTVIEWLKPGEVLMPGEASKT